MRPCAHSHMLTFPHTCQHRFINSHPMCTHTFGICIHSHARAFAHTRLRDLSLSPLLTNVWFPHGPHMCTCTLTSIHTHTSSCTRTCLDGYTPSPSLSPACACGCPPPTIPACPCSHVHITHAHRPVGTCSPCQHAPLSPSGPLTCWFLCVAVLPGAGRQQQRVQ